MAAGVVRIYSLVNVISVAASSVTGYPKEKKNKTALDMNIHIIVVITCQLD